jgi:hypothetical protein
VVVVVEAPGKEATALPVWRAMANPSDSPIRVEEQNTADFGDGLGVLVGTMA